jgi:hypothetical protein
LQGSARCSTFEEDESYGIPPKDMSATVTRLEISKFSLMESATVTSHQIRATYDDERIIVHRRTTQQ